MNIETRSNRIHHLWLKNMSKKDQFQKSPKSNENRQKLFTMLNHPTDDTKGTHVSKQIFDKCYKSARTYRNKAVGEKLSGGKSENSENFRTRLLKNSVHKKKEQKKLSRKGNSSLNKKNMLKISLRSKSTSIASSTPRAQALSTSNEFSFRLKQYQNYLLPKEKPSSKNERNSSRQTRERTVNSNDNLSANNSVVFNTKQIPGTNMLGTLSNRQVLKAYQRARLTQQNKIIQFNRQYIQKLVMLDSDDEQSQNSCCDQNKQLQEQKLQNHSESSNEVTNKKQVQCFGQGQRFLKTDMTKYSEKKLTVLRQREEKLLNLLDNRLSEHDYSEYNKKLFDMKDIDKKRFFARYHNILKKKRQQMNENDFQSSQGTDKSKQLHHWK